MRGLGLRRVWSAFNVLSRSDSSGASVRTMLVPVVAEFGRMENQCRSRSTIVSTTQAGGASESMKTSDPENVNFSTEPGIVLCDCGKPAALKVSGPRSKNAGLRFYTCANSFPWFMKPKMSAEQLSRPSCKFFSWIDTPHPDTLPKRLQLQVALDTAEKTKTTAGNGVEETRAAKKAIIDTGEEKPKKTRKAKAGVDEEPKTVKANAANDEEKPKTAREAKSVTDNGEEKPKKARAGKPAKPVNGVEEPKKTRTRKTPVSDEETKSKKKATDEVEEKSKNSAAVQGTNGEEKPKKSRVAKVADTGEEKPKKTRAAKSIADNAEEKTDQIKAPKKAAGEETKSVTKKTSVKSKSIEGDKSTEQQQEEIAETPKMMRARKVKPKSIEGEKSTTEQQQAGRD